MLFLHDVHDGRKPIPDESKDAYYDPNQGPSWPENDGINILGTPLGSPEFVKEYLQGKLDPSCTKWLCSYRSVQWEMGYGKRGKREWGFGGSRWLWAFGQVNVRGG